MGIAVVACSARGTARAVNQDHITVRTLDDGVLLAVMADGLGGYAGSEEASALASSLVCAQIERSVRRREPLLVSLKRAVQTTNLALWEQAIEREQLMKTTLSALVCTPREALVAHVGDCRVYVLRAGQAQTLTRDHSRAQDMRVWRWLTLRLPGPVSVRGEQVRHALTRVLGDQPIVQVDSIRLALQPGDRFILCSDGIWCRVSAPHIAALATQHDNASLAHTLASEAQARGSTDDASAIVVTPVVTPVAVPSVQGPARSAARSYQPLGAPYVPGTHVSICRHG